MESPTSLEAPPEESDVAELTKKLAATSASAEKSTGKAVKEWSKAVSPITSETINHPGLHPACLEFAPADLDPKYSAGMRCIAHSYFVVGLYEILPEETKTAQEADEPTSKDETKECEGGSLTQAVGEGDGELPTHGEALANGEVPTGREQKRKGGISLYRLEDHQLVWKKDNLQDYGVYDLKFLPHHPIFATSTTIGTIVIHQLQAEEIPETRHWHLTMREIISHEIFPAGKNLITSIAWQPFRDASDLKCILAITVDNSGVYLLGFHENFTRYEILNHGRPLHEHVLKTPYFETKESAYACAFSTHAPVKIFSGGDDSLLRASTLSPCICPGQIRKRPCTEGSTSYKKAIAQSGVTSILPLPIYDSSDAWSILLVGSYDGNVYLCTVFDGEKTSADTITSFALGGGVYHMKFLQAYPDPKSQTNVESQWDTDNQTDKESQTNMQVSFRFLACCMYAGAKIMEVSRNKDGVWSFSILAYFKDLVYVEEGKLSVCYAGDVQPVPVQMGEETPDYSGQRLCVTSSYDDSKLSLWSFDSGESRSILSPKRKKFRPLHELLW